MSLRKLTISLGFTALLLIGCTTTPATPIPTREGTVAPVPTAVSTVSPTIDPSPVPTETSSKQSEPTITATPTPQPTSNVEKAWNWTKLETTSAPPARYDHALALDTENKQLILFGGRADGQVFGDTWVYNLTEKEWRELETPGPSARFGFASVYDPVSRAVYLFGGQQQEFFNDTWKFDTITETWTELETPGIKPDIRYGHGVTLDSQNNRLVISHGFASNGRHDDTWALDLETHLWTELTPSGDKPLKRCLHDIAYAPGSNTVYLFGGCSSGFGPCPQGDLWALDMSTNQWSMASPAGEIPSARENPSIVVDPTTGNILLFGGKSESNVNDLWVFDPTPKTWTQIDAAGPAARKSHDAVFDSLAGQMYLFGGSTSDGATNDLWVLTNN